MQYAAAGWRVIPIKPGAKYPQLPKWQKVATTDHAVITAWYAGLYRGHGVGIATGAESGVFALDVDDMAVLAELEAQHGTLPDTATTVTGSGGRHHLFIYPTDGREVTNANQLPAGIDVRGDGGQIVAPPTIHPNGTPYEWLNDSRTPCAAPEWLLELTQEPPRPIPLAPDRTALNATHGVSSVDEWSQATDWAELLGADGWQYHHSDRTGERYWTRPGKPLREGPSATTEHKGDGGLKVFTSSLAHWGLTEGESYSKHGYLATVHHSGDYKAAAAELRADGWGAQQTATQSSTQPATPAGTAPHPDSGEDIELRQPWPITNLAAVIADGWHPPTPTMLQRTDGMALIYPGRYNTLSGEPGCGKTWVALWCIAEQISAGHNVAVVDYEDTPGALINRLTLLGVTTDDIANHVTYIDPAAPITNRGAITDAGEQALHQLADITDLALVVIDSVGESLAAEAFSPNDDDDVARWVRHLPRSIAHNTGAAVFGLDHVTKSLETRGQWAIGSQRKLAAVDGAAYTITAGIAPTKTEDGRLTVRTAKDRHGTHQRTHIAAEIEVNNTLTGAVAVLVKPPEDPTVTGHSIYQQRIMQAVEDNGGDISGKEMVTDVDGKADHIRVARDELIANGQLIRRQRSGKGGGWLYSMPAPLSYDPNQKDTNQ